MTGLVQDIRYALRQLRKSPGFTSIAVLTLALGIGANTAIFSVVNAVLLRPLAYKDSDRLAVILHDGRNPVAPSNFFEWQKQCHSFERMGAAEYWTPNVSRTEDTEKVWALRITADILPMLGVQPALGRVFLSREEERGYEHEVVLSYQFWQSHFAGNPGVLGQSVVLNGETYDVVGVMPRDFKFAPFWATKAQLWAPLVLGDRINDRDGRSLRIFARLNPGVTLEQAQLEMTAISTQLEHQYPGTNEDVKVLSLKERVVGNVRPALQVLMTGVGFVLLIACANVAHMLLARAAVRQKEITVRAALGAELGRLIRQLLTESLLLATFAGGTGLALALWGIRLLVALSPANLPRVETIGLDWHVLLYVLGITLGSGVVFGLAPTLWAAAPNLSGAMKVGERGSTEGMARNRLRSALVASEFTFALVLLVGAGLMIRSFLAIRAIDPGFNLHNVLSAVVSVAGTGEAGAGKRQLFYQQVVNQIQHTAGVRSVSAINHLPLGGDLWGFPFHVEGQPESSPTEVPVAAYRVVLPGYFKTMKLPLISGRDVTDHDTLNAPGVVVVNDWLARHRWPGQDPIGKRITLDDSASYPAWLTVVGVVKNAVRGEWTEPPDDEMYLPYLQSHDYLENPATHFSYMTLVIRSDGDPATLTPAIRGIVASLDKNVALAEVQTMDQVVASATAEPQFYVLVLGTLAAVALVLAAAGIYGVMSYSVSRRTQEIGIRMALGATRSDLIQLVVRQGTVLAAVGVVTGLVSAFAVTRLMSRLLYSVRSSDPLTFLTVAVLLSVVAVLASYIPARRAAKVDPMVALRYE